MTLLLVVTLTCLNLPGIDGEALEGDQDPTSPPVNEPQIEILEVVPSPDMQRRSPDSAAQRASCNIQE